MIATLSSPTNGGRPHHHLVEHRAERVEVASAASTSPPIACSGGM